MPKPQAALLQGTSILQPLQSSRQVSTHWLSRRKGRLISCIGVECHYDYTRNKPGVKIGIIQTLTQRVGMSGPEQDVFKAHSANSNMLELLEAELEVVRAHQQAHAIGSSPDNVGHNADTIRDLVSSLMEEWVQNRPLSNRPRRTSGSQNLEINDDLPQRDSAPTEPNNQQSNKRRRADESSAKRNNASAQIPPENLINAILDAYFSIAHPFIPIIHEMLFRSRLRDPNERPKLVVVLHAMMVCALRYVANERLATEWLETYPGALQRSREFVVLTGMDGLSVENMQALIIVTFVHISDGEANKAWPLIGTLARAVVYLGLHTEPEEPQRGEVSLKPLIPLPPARVWTEAEERRRVFWNVFLLDRFCSIVTGYVVISTLLDFALLTQTTPVGTSICPARTSRSDYQVTVCTGSKKSLLLPHFLTYGSPLLEEWANPSPSFLATSPPSRIKKSNQKLLHQTQSV